MGIEAVLMCATYVWVRRMSAEQIILRYRGTSEWCTALQIDQTWKVLKLMKEWTHIPFGVHWTLQSFPCHLLRRATARLAPIRAWHLPRPQSTIILYLNHHTPNTTTISLLSLTFLNTERTEQWTGLHWTDGHSIATNYLHLVVDNF